MRVGQKNKLTYRWARKGARPRPSMINVSNEPISFDDIVDQCCYAWNTLIDQPWKVMSIASRDWAVVSQSI